MAGTPECARENGKKGGRPASSPTRMTRVKAEQLAKTNRSPLDVMVDNMLFWFEHSKQLTDQIREKIVDATDEDQRREAFALLKEMLASRENAQKCAVDAAPYCHPKLQSIAFAEKTVDLNTIQTPVDAIEAAEAYRRLISG